MSQSESQQQPQQPLQQPRPFISASVLDRLQTGQFVAQRHNQPSLAQLAKSTTNRRDELSPLAVAKRCIPYEPKVFTDRREVVISLANALNNPSIGVLLVEGDEGSGTTSVARGVVELMGGGPEQVLWLDVEPTLSDNEMVSFLIGYLNRIAASVATEASKPVLENDKTTSNAMAQLRHQLAALAEKPVLIVMDHLGSRVNDRGFWASTLLQELLNFLMVVPSVKVLLVGDDLPTNDMTAFGSRVFSVNLTPTSSATFLWQQVAQRLNATQWENAPSQILGALLSHQLNRDDQRVAAVLACVRHSLSQHDLGQWAEAFKHTDPKEKKVSALSNSLPQFNLQQQLKASPLKPLIRRSLLPQQLLSVLALPPEKRPKNPEDWLHHRYSLYGCGAESLLDHLPPLLIAKTHEFLSQQYLAQRKLALEQRVLPVANSVLVQEARYHEEQAKKARLRIGQQQALKTPTDATTQPHHHEGVTFSEADLAEIAHHQNLLTQNAHIASNASRHDAAPTVILVPSQEMAPVLDNTGSQATLLPQVLPAFDQQWQPTLSRLATAQQAFAQQQWDLSQASLEDALHQLQSVEHQSQQLQAAIHSRLAYVAAINQQWDKAVSHFQQAQHKAHEENHPLGAWLLAQQCLTETLLPNALKPESSQTLATRLLASLQRCELESQTVISPDEDPYGSFWQAVLPPAPLLAELTFRTATLLDAKKSEGSSVAYSAPQLYELAYTRLLEAHQPFAAASAAANRAALFAEAKAYNQAIPWLQRALNLEEANEWMDEAAESHQRLAKAYAKTQQWQSALHHGDCVLRWLQTQENKAQNVDTLSRWQQRLGQWAKTGGFPNQAKVYWLQALETLYEHNHHTPLTPQQQATQNELETWIRQEA